MSCTTMHGVPKSGEIVDLKEYNNAHRSAMLWWKTITEHSAPGKDGKLHTSNFDFFKDCFIGSLKPGGVGGMSLVWDLARNKAVDPVHRAIIRLTFDDVMVERSRLLEFADILDHFVADFGTISTGHAQEIAKDVRELAEGDEHTSLSGVCFTWTSVSDAMWMRKDATEKDEEGDDLWRMFDLSKDPSPQWLFKSMIEGGLWDEVTK